MKRTLLTCCILAATLSEAKAQITNQTFRAEITKLILVLDLHNVAAKKDIDTLNTLMNGQIAYLNSYIKTLQVTVLKEKSDPSYNKNKSLQAAEQANTALITKMTANLTTDNNLYNSIQQLIASNPPPKDSVILGDYNAFAATLQ
jgi:DNA-directed RNA polymerase beta' subunit